jgi:hypothetical protein
MEEAYLNAQMLHSHHAFQRTWAKQKGISQK